MYIQPFEPKTATDAEWEALYRFDAVLHKEFWPDDPHPAPEQFRRDTLNEPPLWKASRYAMWNLSGEIVGLAVTWVSRSGKNQHILDVSIDVLPAWRCQGIGRWLLGPVVEQACSISARLLTGVTAEHVPSGAAFMSRLGGQKARLSSTNVLHLSDLDCALIRRWVEQGETHAADFELLANDGPYPESWLADISRLYDAANDAPRDDLAMEDEHRSPQMLREMEAAFLGRGEERWTLVARQRASGDLAGFTEMYWSPAQPDRAQQAWTVVLPAYRNQGLGRWLKAAMIEKLLRERPAVTRVSTGNANSNAPMLSINRQMGFKAYRTWTFWQIEVDKVKTYLAERLMQPA